MAYIFMDESGDLGFNFSKKKTSAYFIVTFIFTKEKNDLNKIVKSLFKSFSANEIRSHNGILHAYKENPKTRHRLLKTFHEKRCADIITIYLDKKKIYTRLREEKHALYSYITNILLDRVYTKKLIPTDKKICIIASKRETNKFLNTSFSSYLQNHVKNKYTLDIHIEITHPTREKGLQVVDMISWAIFRKYEHGDLTYYNIIKSEIVEENPLFS